jgi:uncharacterized protein YbjT (DUF2867 family)
MNKRLSVLVSGATGKQGGALARTLIASKHTVYALTRQPSSKAGQELQKLGARLINADFDDPQSITKAARGIDAFFLMSTSYEKGAEVEKKQAIDAATAAKTVGIKHLVYTSVASADRNTGIPHFDSKHQVETYIRSLGMPYTIIAPVYFFENNISPWSIPSLKNGILQFALPPEKKMQMVACENIGEFAAHVIENRDTFVGSRIELASDELTGPEIAQAIATYSKKQVSYERQSIEDVRKMSEDFAKMYSWMIEEGYSVDIQGLCKKYPEIGWLSFSEWARKQNWRIMES